MKQIGLFIFILFFSLTLSAQNSSVTGTVVDEQTEEKVFGVKITNPNSGKYAFSETTTGSFNISNLPQGKNEFIFSKDGYDNYYITVDLKDGETYNFGEIKIDPSTGAYSEDIAVVSEFDLEDGQGDDMVSGILHGANDIFVSTSGFILGPLRFRMRGYKTKYTEVTINGVPMHNLESNFVSWANWGGLNNVTRNNFTTTGLYENEYAFGSIGGATNINMRTSEYRPGTAITYSLLNKAYNHRAMFTHSTGLRNNWALTISGSRRWAEEGYVEGTFYDAWAYFVGIERKINKKHSINLVVFASPNRRGKQAPSTQEAYDLVDNNYYNPNWGYQGDVKRNSKISNFHQPIAVLTHYFDLNKTTNITTSIAYKTGRGGNTSLNWYNAPDPRPDYYRNLPSYFTSSDQEKEFIIQQFKNDPKYSQINWDKIYQINYLCYDEIENANGQIGNTVKGLRSEYIVEERRSDEQMIAGNSTLLTHLNDNIKLVYGIQYISSKVHNFSTVNDLLGGDFWVDNDKYAERDLITTGGEAVAYNDIRFPNRIVKVGDIFGYDYVANTDKAKTWGQLEFNYKKLEFFIAGFGSYTTFWRTGNMQNGKFPDISLGDSEKNNFLDYGTKGGLTFKINGRNYINVHAGYLTNSPTFRDAYLSPRTRNSASQNLVSEKITSFDGSYLLRAPRFKASVTAYYTQFNDAMENLSFYHDAYKNYVNYVIKDINSIYQGIELGLEADITSTFTITGVTSLGYYRYSSRPTYDVYIDNSASTLKQNQTIYYNNFLIPGTPQTAASMSLKYRSPKYWFLEISGSYLDDNYLSPNPDRRTSEALEGVETGSDQYYDIVDQELLPEGYVIDASIGYSVRIKGNMLLLNFSVSNILNNTEIITGGYEQLRFDDRDKNPEKFPAKYFYNFGRTYYLNTSFRF